MFIFDAAMHYMATGHAHGDFAGEEYGTRLQPRLGRQGAVAGHQGRGGAQLERIHRSNLVGMGVCRCSSRRVIRESLGLTGTEIIDVVPDPPSRRKVTRSWWSPPDRMVPCQEVTVTLRIDTPIGSGLLPRRRHLPLCCASCCRAGQGSASIGAPKP